MILSLFRTRSDVLAKKLKVRTRQLETINRLSRLRDQSSSKSDFLDNAALFIGHELASRFVAIVLKDGDKLELASATVPDVAEQNSQLIIDLATGAINTRQNVVINNNRAHTRLRNAKVACALATPLWFKQQSIGAIVVFRFKQLPFMQRSLHTISTLADQLPPALDYVVAGENVQQKNKELRIIYETDKVKEKYGKDTQTLLDALAELIQKHTSAKGTFVMLFDSKSNSVKFGSIGTANAHRAELEQFAKDAIAEGETINEPLAGRLREGVCVPVTIGDDHAAFGMVNSSNESFSEEDKRILTAIALQSDNALLEDREKKRIKEVFSRYVSSEVLEVVLNDENPLRSERHEVTMLFADIRGFTAMSEKIGPEKVVTMLNDYFTVMTEIILKNKGTLDKFVGDEIVAMFGAPVFFEDHAKRAVTTAIEMQRAFRTLQLKWRTQGMPSVGLGIGMDSGNVVVGNIGGEQRANYTAIGDHVNTAARLCSQATDGQVLMTSGTYDQVRRSVLATELPAVPIKGKSQAVKVYNATGLK